MTCALHWTSFSGLDQPAPTYDSTKFRFEDRMIHTDVVQGLLADLALWGAEDHLAVP